MKKDKKEKDEDVEKKEIAEEDELLESSKSEEDSDSDTETSDDEVEEEDESESDGDDAVLEAAIRIVNSAFLKKKGKAGSKPIVESAKKQVNTPERVKPSTPHIPVTIFEAGNIAEYQEMRVRDNAMTIVQAWIDGGDYTYDSIYALCVADADFDKSGKIDNPEEVAYYNELILAVADALTGMGISTALAQKFIDSEDNEAGDEIGNQLSETMGNEDALDPGDVINKYAVSGVVTEGAAIPILESTYRAVSGGKVVIKQKKLRKHKMSSAQKAGLAKARKKAHSSSANAHRSKSVKVRHQKNL